MILWFFLLVVATLPALDAQPAKPQNDSGADWPMYNRDLAGTRYSPLKQINTGNVAKLTRAWSFHLAPDSTTVGITGGSEFTPIVVNDVMYLATGNRVVALEPETGREVWRYELQGGRPS